MTNKTPHTKYKFFNYHIFVCASIVFISAWVLDNVSISTEKFNPLAVAIEDFKMTDIVFQEFKTPPPVDSNIVLVNIGNLNRGELAQEIALLAQWQPAVMALDAMLIRNKDPKTDSILGAIMRSIPNFVLASKLDSLNEDNLIHTTLIKGAATISNGLESAYVNLVADGEEGFRTTRDFTFKAQVGDTFEYSFPAKVCELFSPKAFETLRQREGKYEKEMINFAGDERSFIKIDYPDIFDPRNDFSFLKGKIVLLGYLGNVISYGNNPEDLIDVFYTPLNEHVAGRAYPDMYGITVHANILSQMLQNKYINQSSENLSLFTAIALAILNIAIFLFLARRFEQIFEALMRVLQALQIIVFTGIQYYLLSVNDYNFDLTLSITLLVIGGEITIIYSSALFKYVDRIKIWLKQILQKRDSTPKIKA